MHAPQDSRLLQRIGCTPCRFGLVGSLIHILTIVAIVAVLVRVIHGRRCPA